MEMILTEFSIEKIEVKATPREIKVFYTTLNDKKINGKYIRDCADRHKEAAKQLYEVVDYMDLNRIEI